MDDDVHNGDDDNDYDDDVDNFTLITIWQEK